MTVEVRQMTIRSQVGGEAAPAEAAQRAEGLPLSEEQYRALRRQLLAECRAWLEEELRLRAER